MDAGQGLGTLLFTTPLPRIPILEPCFPFSPLGTPTRFSLILRSPRSSCLYVFLLITGTTMPPAIIILPYLFGCLLGLLILPITLPILATYYVYNKLTTKGINS